jgi:hypothetical protein
MFAKLYMNDGEDVVSGRGKFLSKLKAIADPAALVPCAILGAAIGIVSNWLMRSLT